jgi:aromatic ring-opening dioxygenase LigB subunit
MAGSIVFVGIAPHPPIMVPEVGREAIAEVRGSIDAMRELTERIIACGAETIIIISPHAPLEARAFVAYGEAELRGDFANFRAPQATIDAPLDLELLEAITASAAADGFQLVPLEGYELDHGTAVPLYLRFGACIRRAVEASERQAVAFIASGDLSHRLTPDAPAGFNRQAHLFDEEVVAAIGANTPRRIIDIDQNLRRLAGECGYRSMLVAIGTTEEESPRECEVLHYEAPFGVGYMVAQLARTTRSSVNE